MTEANALFRLLNEAPPRSAEIVKKVTLTDISVERLGELYGLDLPRTKILFFRALLDVLSTGSIRLDDKTETASLASPLTGELLRVSQLQERLVFQREELKQMYANSAVQFENSPERVKEEWLRRVAIVLVLALTAFFYWRQNP